MLEQQMTNDEPQKPAAIFEKQDYSGAHEKTDPAEIALVKKLDRWIMVSASERVMAEATGLTSVAHALEHVLAQLPGPQCHRTCSSE